MILLYKISRIQEKSSTENPSVPLLYAYKFLDAGDLNVSVESNLDYLTPRLFSEASGEYKLGVLVGSSPSVKVFNLDATMIQVNAADVRDEGTKLELRGLDGQYTTIDLNTIFDKLNFKPENTKFILVTSCIVLVVSIFITALMNYFYQASDEKTDNYSAAKNINVPEPDETFKFDEDSKPLEA